VAHLKEVGIEHNPPQEFWLQILDNVYKELAIEYPNSRNALYFNFYFCVFELDALVVLDNKYIAFEIIGTHYLQKTFQ
jgi:hypothetical protein